MSSSAQRLSSGDELLSSGEEAAGMGGSRAAMRAQHGPATTAPAAVPATSAEEGQDSSSGAASSSPACADSSSTSSGGVIPAAWSPGGGGSTGAARPPRLSPVRGCGQSRQALLDVVAQLQGEVAVAESRRHEAEQAAEEAQQTVQDLRRQVDKVQALAASKVRGWSGASCGCSWVALHSTWGRAWAWVTSLIGLPGCRTPVALDTNQATPAFAPPLAGGADRRAVRQAASQFSLRC